MLQMLTLRLRMVPTLFCLAVAGCPPRNTPNHVKPGIEQGTLAATLIGLNMTPLPDTPGELELGTVLRNNQALVALPDEAFERPEQLRKGPWIPVGADGNYRDSLSESGRARAYLHSLLRGLGINVTAAGSAAQQLETELAGLQKQSVSEVSIDNAVLTRAVQQKMKSSRTGAVTVVQGVYRPAKLRLKFTDERGGLVSVDAEAKPPSSPISGGGHGAATRSTTSTGELSYDSRVIGYEPYFRAGGPRTAMTPQLAAELALALKESGVSNVQALDNGVVVARPSYDQLDLVSSFAEQFVTTRQLAEAAATRDHELSDARARIEELAMRSSRDREQLAQLAAQVESQRAEFATQLEQTRAATEKASAQYATAAESLRTREDVAISLLKRIEPIRATVADLRHRAGPAGEPRERIEIAEIRSLLQSLDDILQEASQQLETIAGIRQRPDLRKDREDDFYPRMRERRN